MSETTIPSTAVPFPASPIFTEYQTAVLVQGIGEQVDDYNLEAGRRYAHACADWTATNIMQRARQLPPTPKPVAVPSQVLKHLKDERGTMWIWIEPGPPVGPPCPDLPPMPEKPPAGQPAIGQHLYGNFYRALPGDTAEDGASVDVPPAEFPIPPGKYYKVMTPWGGIWEKVA